MSTPLRDLEALFEPQERFAQLCAITFRRFGRKIVDLSYANPYDGPEEDVRRAIQVALAEERELAFQYTPYGGKTTTRQRIASKLREEYKLPFEYRDVIMTPGAMAALNIAFRALFGSDDEVIVLTPCWLDYPLYLQNLGIPIRFVKLKENKHFDLAAVQDALNSRTKGILLSQPCCPTGVLYPEEELEGLAALLVQAEQRFNRDIYLISDEVHRRLIWTSNEFYSPLFGYPRSLSVYSFGKALFLQGQRIGYVAVSPRMPERNLIRTRLERCVQIMGFCTPTTLMQRAIIRLLDHQPRIDLIAARQEAIRGRLKEYGYEVCDAEATWFVYVKSPLPDDQAFSKLLADHGILVLPSTLFHERGYFRISVTARYEPMMATLDAFRRVLDKVDYAHASLPAEHS